MDRFERRVRRTRRGDFELRLPRVEREALRGLPAQLRQLLREDDPAVERLFPPAHRDDDELAAQFRELTLDELKLERLTAIEVMESTMDAARIDEDQLTAWMKAVNDLRLVLGTRLEVTEETYGEEIDPDDPRAPSFALYHYLSFLEEQIVEALSEVLPQPKDSDR